MRSSKWEFLFRDAGACWLCCLFLLPCQTQQQNHLYFVLFITMLSGDQLASDISWPQCRAEDCFWQKSFTQNAGFKKINQEAYNQNPYNSHALLRQFRSRLMPKSTQHNLLRLFHGRKIKAALVCQLWLYWYFPASKFYFARTNSPAQKHWWSRGATFSPTAQLNPCLSVQDSNNSVCQRGWKVNQDRRWKEGETGSSSNFCFSFFLLLWDDLGINFLKSSYLKYIPKSLVHSSKFCSQIWTSLSVKGKPREHDCQPAAGLNKIYKNSSGSRAGYILPSLPLKGMSACCITVLYSCKGIIKSIFLGKTSLLSL